VSRHDIASALLTAGADVNASGDSGNTPLHYAAESEQDAELAELLISHGANIEQTNKYRETPLQIAAAQNPAVARLFLESGAKLDLNSAVLLGSLADVERLLKHDPQLHEVPLRNNLPRQAVMSGSQLILQLLAEYGVKPDSSALFEALTRILNGLADIDLLRLLLDAGGDPNARMYGDSGDTAIQYAKRFRKGTTDEVVTLLKRYGAIE
jgi:ankyrin repeat protein